MNSKLTVLGVLLATLLVPTMSFAEEGASGGETPTTQGDSGTQSGGESGK